MDKQWFYAHDGDATGSFSTAAMRNMLEAGVLSQETFVWAREIEAWIPAGEVQAFEGGAPPVAHAEKQHSPASQRRRDDESAARTMYIASCTTFAILLSLALYDAFQGERASESVLASHSVERGETIHQGDTVTGRLAPTDALLDDSTRYDNWLYEGVAGERIDVRLKSEAFDSYLFIRASDPALPKVLGENDDGGSGTNARLQVKLPQDGTYAIVVNSYLPDEQGTYTLVLSGTKSE